MAILVRPTTHSLRDRYYLIPGDCVFEDVYNSSSNRMFVDSDLFLPSYQINIEDAERLVGKRVLDSVLYPDKILVVFPRRAFLQLKYPEHVWWETYLKRSNFLKKDLPHWCHTLSKFEVDIVAILDIYIYNVDTTSQTPSYYISTGEFERVDVNSNFRRPKKFSFLKPEDLLDIKDLPYAWYPKNGIAVPTRINTWASGDWLLDTIPRGTVGEESFKMSVDSYLIRDDYRDRLYDLKQKTLIDYDYEGPE